MCFHDNTYLPTFQNLKHPNKITKQPSIFPDWSLWEYIMHFFRSFWVPSHMLTIERVKRWCRDTATQRGFLAASLHLYVIVPGSDSDKNAKKMRILFIPGPESQVLLQKNWRRLKKIVGCCSDVLNHFIISYYAVNYYSTHNDHFLCVH